MEILPIFLQSLEGVSRRVYAHEKWNNLAVDIRVLCFQGIHDFSNFHHFGPADIGAPSKSKVK